MDVKITKIPLHIDQIKEIIKDGGFKSRKLLMTIFTMVLVLVGWILSAIYVSLTAQYPTYCTTLVSLLLIFVGGSVSNQFGTSSVLKNIARREDGEIPPGP